MAFQTKKIEHRRSNDNTTAVPVPPTWPPPKGTWGTGRKLPLTRIWSGSGLVLTGNKINSSPRPSFGQPLNPLYDAVILTKTTTSLGYSAAVLHAHIQLRGQR